MSMITIYPPNINQYTMIPNIFIDDYLSESNGDFVRVYLLINRYASKNMDSISMVDIADCLHLTETDVLRAIKYWESNNVMIVKYDDSKNITSIKLNDPSNISAEINNTDTEVPNETVATKQIEARINVSTKPQYKMEEISTFMSRQNYKQLIYITQKYLGKMLTQQDINTLIGFNDWLGLPFEVIELLIEYCVSNNHRNMNYIEKVAVNWADEGINTVAKAENRIETFNNNYFKVMKSLGIGDRNPTPKQISYMKKWIDEYDLSMEIIVEACNRTMETIHQPQFSYIDAILKNWHKNNVKTIKNIDELDKQHQLNSKTKKKEDTKNQSKFINYDQRTYNFDELEKKAMELLIKETDGSY
ncbi:DNA replication protein DnaD [Vallitalea longa]|uniref:DNA replication protein DnaD n=1 Tax=Vallitalea longa TaxID=2936439 RepID=A0A9W5YDD3_9FIRM|nr:DnaD domain protein [Vallitalea longa]GKX30551.1 DNA replication protein DnaD [Vallitalea longa]